MDFININADLHFHGLYSGGVSKEMLPKIIAEQAKLKGLNLVGSADILNGRWIKLVKEQLKKIDDGILERNGIKFLLQTEVEDKNRVHHVLFFPSFEAVYNLRKNLKKYCKDLDSDGRPKLLLNGEELAELCKEEDILIGFAHAFTPYFGLYARFDSYKECYGKYWKYVCFAELGLSADSNMADRISELHELTFLSNSDSHSPWPNRLGREFNVFRVKEISFDEIKKALQRKNGRKIILNVGLNPLEGKYHKTRCRGCLTFFKPEDAIKLNWRCPICNNQIKKGVDYRIKELADLPEGKHPEHRPRYIHIIPLAEIIALAHDMKNVNADHVQLLWRKFINAFSNEINVLLNISIEKLTRVDEKSARFIDYFRQDKIKYIPGGGGVYGKLVAPGKEEELNKIKEYSLNQKTLNDF